MFGVVKNALIAAVLCAAAIPAPAPASTLAAPLAAETATEPVALPAHFEVGIRELSLKTADGKNEFATCSATIRALIQSALAEADPEQVLAVRQGRFAPEALTIIFAAGQILSEPEPVAVVEPVRRRAAVNYIRPDVGFLGGGRATRRYLAIYVGFAMQRHRMERAASAASGASAALCVMRGGGSTSCLLRSARSGVAVAAGYPRHTGAIRRGSAPRRWRSCAGRDGPSGGVDLTPLRLFGQSLTKNSSSACVM